MAKWKLEWSRMFGKQMRFQETFGYYSKQERASDSQLRIYLLTCKRNNHKLRKAK